ncbi:MAG: leucyl aminopeptidase family protein, partial [Xanthobacteraceae bacterium]
MPDVFKLDFVPATRLRGVLVAFCGENLKFGPTTKKALLPAEDLIRRAAAADRFSGKSGSVLEIVAPQGLDLPRLVLIGTGKDSEFSSRDIVKLGGIAMGKVPAAAAQATFLAEFGSGPLKPDQVADLALGARLRAYSFDRYKTKRKERAERADKVEIGLACANPAAVQKAWGHGAAVADGVVLARDLINEPANVLYPGEFARRALGLGKLGVGVDVLDVPAMKKLGMGALLGVGQGSGHDSRLVVLRWNGDKRGADPIAFIGKGVCFDTGGISIKPAQGMEDMKGDMAGAACV